jgi:hypothetical protein
MEPEPEDDSKKKKLIIGGTIFCLIIVLVIIIMGATAEAAVVTPVQPDTDDGDDEGPTPTPHPIPEPPIGTDNPMVSIFNEEPEFSSYTYENSNQAYEDELWKDPIFGGSILEPLVRPHVEGEEEVLVENSMPEDMQAYWENRDALEGYFVIKNV